MNLRSFDLNLLLVFDAIYADRSITGASKRLGMTQPAVSNALSRLREKLGNPLFERSGHGMAPTAEAMRIAPEIQNALRAIRGVVSGTDGFDPPSSIREFRMIVPDAIEPVIMGPLLEHSLGSAPGITYALDPLSAVNFVESVRSKTVDLGFFVNPVYEDRLRTVLLFSEPSCVVVRADHPVYGNRDVFTLDDLFEASFVAITPELRRLTQIEQQCQALGRTRRVVCTTKRIWSVPYMVSSSGLAGCLPLHIAEALADKLNLKLFEPPIKLAPESWHMVWHEDFDNDPGHHWLRSMIHGFFTDLITANA